MGVRLVATLSLVAGVLCAGVLHGESAGTSKEAVEIVQRNVRIGALWSDGTVTLPAAWRGDDASMYIGTGYDAFTAHRRKSEVLLNRSWPESWEEQVARRRMISRVGYDSTRVHVAESEAALLGQVPEDTLIVAGHGEEVRVVVSDYVRVRGGCGDDLLGLRLRTTLPGPRGSGSAPVLVSLADHVVPEFVGVPDTLDTASVPRSVVDTVPGGTGNGADRWYRIAGPTESYYILYREHLGGATGRSLARAERILLRLSDRAVKVLDRRGWKMYNEISHVRDLRGYAMRSLGQVHGLYTFEGLSLMLETRTGYESRKTVLFRVNDTGLEQILHDGTYRGC